MQIARRRWQSLRKKLMELAGADLSVVAATVETTCGPAVERLFELGCAIYPIHPKAGERYRERKAPCGGKSDPLDAWSFADALRTDGHAWRRLSPEDPLAQELRLLCRDERHLIAQRTALINQLRQALLEYYPAALEAFEDWTTSGAWDFVIRFPSPAALAKAGKRAWEKFLHTHRLYRPSTYARRLEIFARAQRFCGTEPVTQAKSLLAVSVAKQLQVLQRQLDEYRERIEQLFRQHPDHDLFGSLPGAGDMLAPRLLSECGQDRQRFEDHEALQCYAGTAPVSFQSGQMHVVRFRWACNRQLRAAVHLWADCSRKQCTWAQVYYQHKRQEAKPRLCHSLSGPAMAQDPLENVADPAALRRTTAHAQSGPPRLVGPGSGDSQMKRQKRLRRKSTKCPCNHRELLRTASPCHAVLPNTPVSGVCRPSLYSPLVKCLRRRADV
jgi:transposase